MSAAIGLAWPSGTCMISAVVTGSPMILRCGYEVTAMFTNCIPRSVAAVSIAPVGVHPFRLCTHSDCSSYTVFGHLEGT